ARSVAPALHPGPHVGPPGRAHRRSGSPRRVLGGAAHRAGVDRPSPELLIELVEGAVARVLVLAPAHDLRPVADPAVGDVVEGDLDDQLRAERDPLEVAVARPA